MTRASSSEATAGVTTAQAMAIAIYEGRKGAGFVAPNPLVGCVLLDKNRNLLATGYHHRLGGAHAEIDALSKLSSPSLLEGGHVYVTLEPCAHQGRTGSCAQALLPLRPASVTFAVEDPNPLVAGKGAAILRAAGIDCELLSARRDLLAAEASSLTADCEELAEIFLHNFRVREPFVAMKVASSLDGKMAYASGESKWITGEPAREHVHALRARYDAIAIGRSTFVADNPSLNVRHSAYPGFANRVVLFDPDGSTLASLGSSNLLAVRDASSVFVVVDAKANIAESSGVRILRVPMHSPDEFMIDELLASLRAEGITSLMLEGGAQTYGAFFRAGRVQRVHVYMAPIIMGGRSGLSWSSAFGGTAMSERLELKRVERVSLGRDEYWTARV